MTMPVLRASLLTRWEAIIRPRFHGDKLSPGQLRRTRMFIILSAMSILMQLLVLPIDVFMLMTQPVMPIRLLGFWSLPATYIAYELSRRGRVNFSLAFINVLGFAANILLCAANRDSQVPYHLNFLIALLVINCVFLPMSISIAILVAQLAIIAIFPALVPTYTFYATFSQTFPIHLTLGATAIVVIYFYRFSEDRHRHRLMMARQSLRETERRARHILENVPASVFMINAAGNLTFFGGGESISPLLDAAAVGRPIFDLLGDSADIQRDVQRALAGETFSSLIEMHGQFYHMNFNQMENSPPDALAGERTTAHSRSVMVLALNVSDRMQSEARRTQLALEQERLRVVSHFLGDFSHDVRTPLTVISTSVYLIQKLIDAETHERIQKHIAAINNQIRHFIEQLQNVQNIVRLSEEHVDYWLRPYDAGLLLAQIAEEFEPDMSQRTQHLRIETDDGADLRVFVDGDEIKRALRQIMNNAVCYTPEAGEIVLSVRREAEHVLLQVRDSGIGIAPDALGHIFEPLYRAAPERDSQTGGMGLGLSLALAIVNAHHGTLTVESSIGQGSTFTLALAGLDTFGRTAELERLHPPPEQERSYSDSGAVGGASQVRR